MNMNFKEFFKVFTEDLDARIPYLLNKYKNQTDENIRQLASADPTPNNKYIDWIVKNSEQFRIPEDINKIKSTLDKFKKQSKSKKWQGSKDINTYKSYRELVMQLEVNVDVTNMEPVQPTQDRSDKRIKIKEENGLIIYRVNDAQTIIKIAQGTEWCVRDEPYASDYLKKGPYYVIYKESQTDIEYYKDKNGRISSPDSYDNLEYPLTAHGYTTPIVLIHFPTGQIKNKYDSEIDIETAEEIYPLIQNSFKNAKFNYNDGISDFQVFLKRQKNKGADGTIAQGSDKEILEKYNEPQQAYDKLYTTSRINNIPPLERRKLKESISKSKDLTFMYLTHLHSLRTNNRDTFMEEKLIMYNDKSLINHYAVDLITVANSTSMSGNIPRNRFVAVLKKYGEPFTIKRHKTELYEFFNAHSISLDDILLEILKNKSLKTLTDVRDAVYTIANTDKIQKAVNEYLFV